jgi:hypothetical protein
MGVAADAAPPLSLRLLDVAGSIGIDNDLPHSSSSNLSDAYAQPRPRRDRHDTYKKCTTITTCDMMHDVSWLSNLKSTFAIENGLRSLAKALPHTTDPIASSSSTSARRPYAQRRRAGDSAASISQHMVDSAVVVIAQSHIHDIA